MESGFSEALEIIKQQEQQVEFFERCLKLEILQEDARQRSQDKEKVQHLLNLANSQGKPLAALKDDIALLKQKIRRSIELSTQLITELTTKCFLSFTVFVEALGLLEEIADNYWQFFLPMDGKTFFENLASVLSKVESVIDQESKESDWVVTDKESLEICKNASQRSLNSAIKAAEICKSLLRFEEEQLQTPKKTGAFLAYLSSKSKWESVYRRLAKS